MKLKTSNDSITLTVTNENLITTTKCRKVAPKITSVEGFNPRRGNKSNFNDKNNIPVKISITTHDNLFRNYFFFNNKQIVNKYDIPHKKQEAAQSSTNFTKINKNNISNNKTVRSFFSIIVQMIRN